MLKVGGGGEAGDPEGAASSAAGGLSLDLRRRQVTLTDPAAAASTLTPEDRKLGVAAPKMFAFDAIFTEQESKSEICGSALSDVIHAVLNGTDGCLFTFGHSKLGKTSTMIGSAESLGAVPCAISWLYRCITEQKSRSGARFSVRVSCLEVSAVQQVNDLLARLASESDHSPSLYLCEGALQSYCELRAPSPEKAASYLDSALASKSDHSHLFYTLHVYQYSVAGKGGVAGGRSRLHLIDLAGYDRTRSSGMPLSAIGNVLLAIFNGQKHLPHREQKLSQQLKECMGSLTCHVAMLAHVSPLAAAYSETLTTIQLASRIHRMRRKKIKFPGMAGAGGEEAGGGGGKTGAGGGSDVDPSSSEQSADTVIYMGPSEETDGEHPPVFIPSLNSGDNRCAMNKALRGSLAEHKLKLSASRSVPVSPQRSLSGGGGGPGVAGGGEDRGGGGVAGGGGGSLKRAGRAGQQQPQVSSTRSSPARRQSEERWVDGPRVLKSRVSEGRQIGRGNRDREKRETWVDGPKGYGFMDQHKKNMIRRWVENQSQLVSRGPSSGGGGGGGTAGAGGFEPRTSSRGQTEGLIMSQPPNPAYPTQNKVLLPEKTASYVDGTEADLEDDEEMEVEIIEVEESAEPVPMMDCCLQVTEEDIALCMGELENPLPEVDQEEHPLRILSQENLTVVSTFADSISVANDLEKLIPRNVPFFRDPSGWQQTLESPADILSKKLNQYEQLRALHELYRLRKTEVKPVSRCQSLMFSQLIPSSSPPPSDLDANSIASEPPYRPGENGKFCDNCKVNLGQLDDMKLLWEKQELTQFHSIRNYSRSISALRHPDGASNPNLRETGGGSARQPGAGAEVEGGGKAGGEDEARRDEDEDIVMPPPLSGSMYTLNREGFDNMKSLPHNVTDLRNGQVHDPGGKEGGEWKGGLGSWDEAMKAARLRGSIKQNSTTEQQKFTKTELTSQRHRIFSPLYVFSSCISRHNCDS